MSNDKYRAVKVLYQMNFVQFSSSFAHKIGPLVQFIVQFLTIKIQEKRNLVQFKFQTIR